MNEFIDPDSDDNKYKFWNEHLEICIKEMKVK